MTCIIDLASRRPATKSTQRLTHPAGVEIPSDDPSMAELIVPEVRTAISSGTHDADIIRLLPEAVEPDDRVLVIGAGIGVVSTLIAKREGVGNVVAIEANVSLVPHLRRVHAVNGVPWVLGLNGVISGGATGRVPFFARADYRTSSLLPEIGPWHRVMLVPTLDLGLILADEQISLVVCDLPHDSMNLLADTDLSRVERILVSHHDGAAWHPETARAETALAEQGFTSETRGGATLLRRDGAAAARTWPPMAMTGTGR